MPQPDANRLQELLDKQDIHEALMRYCRGVDRCDREVLGSAFHPDAVVNHAGPIVRGDEIAEFIISRNLVNAERQVHRIANELVTVTGDKAFSESYFFADRIARSGDFQQFSGRYIDHFERRDGAWRIARRTVVVEWSTIGPFRDANLAPDSVIPRRDREDISYSAAI